MERNVVTDRHESPKFGAFTKRMVVGVSIYVGAFLLIIVTMNFIKPEVAESMNALVGYLVGAWGVMFVSYTTNSIASKKTPMQNYIEYKAQTEAVFGVNDENRAVNG